MTIKAVKFLALPAMLLMGCTSMKDPVTELSTGGPVYTPTALEKVVLKVEDDKRFRVSETSQSLVFEDIDSPVAAFQLPVVQSGVSVEITSHISDTVFRPLAIVYDQAGEVITQISADEFTYTKPRLADGNRLIAKKSVFPSPMTSEMVLVVYTDKDSLGQTTPVIHPARLDAEVRGNHLPEVKDIPIPHSLSGEISVSLTPVSKGWFDKAGSNLSEEKKAPAIAPLSTTKEYYLDAIKEAVRVKNIARAAALVDEANALNINEAQAVFVDAVQKSIDAQ